MCKFESRKVWGLWLLVAVLGISLAAAQSQITTGTIQGAVSDESGAVMPGVTVTLRHVATGLERTALSDDAGRYTVPLLPVGGYEISGELTGFAKTVQT